MGIEILDIISEGRFFRILKARQGTKFIILKAAKNPGSMFVEMLRREYELGKSLSHACVVSTLDFVEDTPVGECIILEYIEGRRLDEFLIGKPSVSQRMAVLNDILDAVDYLHHRGVLHNDLKPLNIIVTPNGTARIIDFGLSTSDDSIYKGCVGGSDGYSAPEIMQGKGPSGAASDIYSLGRLIELMFGQKKHRSIVAKSLRENPSDRYRSVRSLKKALSFRRRIPVVAAAVIPVVVLLALVLVPKIDRMAHEAAHEDLRSRLSSEMNRFYIPVLKQMQTQKSQISASAIKGEYLLRYIHYRDSLPQHQRLACEEVFAAQAAVLDSIYLSLP